MKSEAKNMESATAKFNAAEKAYNAGQFRRAWRRSKDAMKFLDRAWRAGDRRRTGDRPPPGSKSHVAKMRRDVAALKLDAWVGIRRKPGA